MVAVNHMLKSDKDEKTIGILVCKDKDGVLANYSIESSSTPIGISSFDLSKLVPHEYKRSIPTIEEFEKEISTKIKGGNKQ